MKKFIVLFGVLLAVAVAQAQVVGKDSLNKGVTATGMVRNGCDCEEGQVFDTRRGQDTIVPRVTRTGKLLTVTSEIKDTIPGCGTTDEEVLVDITVKWTGNYISRITHCGVQYVNQISTSDELCKEDTVWKRVDSIVSICGDTTIRIMLQLLCPGSIYVLKPYVVTIYNKEVEGDNLVYTKPRNRCGGWIKNDTMEASTLASNDSIILVYDGEGNSYGVVQIGNQCWTRENMRCNNSPNHLILEGPEVGFDPIKGVQYDVSNKIPYRYRYDALNLSFRQRGNLYNWPAVVDTSGLVKELPPGVRRGICPVGWHVPNVYEWYELVKNVLNGNPSKQIGTLQSFHKGGFQGDSVVKLTFGCNWPVWTSNAFPGGYMSEADNGLRNQTWLSILPANNLQGTGYLGYYNKEGEYVHVANFWLATPDSTSSAKAYSWHVDHNESGVSSFSRERERAFSVRCIRDQLTIAVSPNTSKFCAPGPVLYTAKVAQENPSDFTFTWYVYKDGAQVGDSVRCNPFQYTHEDVGKYKIVCHAVRPQGTLSRLDVWDSVFMKGTETCPNIMIDPPQPTCSGQTITVTATTTLTSADTLIWRINDQDTSALSSWEMTPVSDTSFTCKFPESSKDSTYTFQFIKGTKDCYRQDPPCDASPSATGEMAVVVGAYPTITVCQDCDVQGFVIKSISKVVNNTQTVWRDNLGNAVEYNRKYKAGDTVKITNNLSPYSVEMVSTGGCRDTVRNLVLKERVSGCHIAADSKYESEVYEDGTTTRIVSVQDHENNQYAVVEIGGVCWMKENMRATTTPNYGNNIVNPDNLTENNASKTYRSRVAHWWYNNPANERFGLLYNWCAAVDTSVEGNADDPWSCQLPANHRGICPEGWHLPSNNEWTNMETALNGGISISDTDTLAGLLAGGCDWKVSTIPHAPGYYHGPDWAASGFTAMPGGMFNNNKFDGKGEQACFWSATENPLNNGQAYQRTLKYDQAWVIYNPPGSIYNPSGQLTGVGSRQPLGKNRGFSVRCTRDIPQMVLHKQTTDSCAILMYASVSPESEISHFSFEWKVNGITQGSDSSKMIFVFGDTNQYKIVCAATHGGDVLKDSILYNSTMLSNWPPTLTLCPDSIVFPVKIISSTNVASATRKSGNEWVPQTTTGYLDLPVGRYPVRLTNSNGYCKPDTMVVKAGVSTSCLVYNPDTGEGGVETGVGNTIFSVKDADNNSYHVVQIGNRCWTRENMRTTQGLVCGNGSPNAFTSNATQDSSTSYYYSYYSQDTMPLAQRGYLYNWKAASQICPSGWHLPSLQEWKDLRKAVMGSANRNCKMAAGCDWETSYNPGRAGNDTAADRNSSYFSLIAAGDFGNASTSSSGVFKFEYLKKRSNYWTSTPYDETHTYRMNFSYNEDGMNAWYPTRDWGYSVRCVRDIPQLVLHQQNTDSCAILMYATVSPESQISNFTFEWKVNGITQGSDSSKMIFVFGDANQYKIVCATTVGGYDLKDSIITTLSNWPPTLTLCSDSIVFPVKISSTNVDSAAWKSGNEWVPQATTGYVDLPVGRYPVRLFNSSGFCKPDTMVVKAGVSTSCMVYNPDTGEGGVETGVGNTIFSVKDADNNSYHVVQIGNRCWTRENMRATHGLACGNGSPNAFTSNATQDANTAYYYSYYSQDTMPLAQRGYLYNLEAAKQICPSGWHLPSLQEWKDLKEAVMGSATRTCRMAGGCDWNTSNVSGAAGNYTAADRNSSYFSLIPAGNLGSNNFENLKIRSSYWTSTPKDGTQTYRISFINTSNDMNVTYQNIYGSMGYSVRCVRDNSTFCVETITNSQGGQDTNLITSLPAGEYEYDVVQVGSRCWTKENLRETIDSTGTSITPGTKPDNISGYTSTSTAYYYNYNPSAHVTDENNHKAVDILLEKRGYLYNWPAAMRVCPSGWHLPSCSEWDLVAKHADDNNNTAMLSSCEYWRSGSTTSGSPGKCQTNDCPQSCNILLFSLIPAGNMSNQSKGGKFDYGGNSANFWTSEKVSGQTVKSYRIYFNYDKSQMNDGNNAKSQIGEDERGLSVRCVRNY